MAWGDVDNDGDLDLLHWGFDQLGNGEAQILINDIDAAGRRDFTASFDLPAFDRIHQAEWGDWNRDGWIDLLVSGQRTGADFVPRNVVEVLQNNGGIGFQVVTPAHWAAAITDWEGDPTAILRAAWGDLDADGLPDVAVSSGMRDSLLVLPGNGDTPFEQELLAGMSGTRLQFGHFDSEQGEHGSADRDLLNPVQRLASGMDIAAHGSWQGLDYSQVSQGSTVRFWESDSSLFDIPLDLVVLDGFLAALEPQLPGYADLELDADERNNQRLDSTMLVQLELGRGSFEASYALFRLPRSLFEDPDGSFLFSADTGVEESAPDSQSALVELARDGAGSELDAFLLKNQEHWQLLGNGAFNQTPLTFRHDPEYVYFLGIDDSLIGVRDNVRSDLLNAPFNLSELTGEKGVPVVHHRPLPLNSEQSPLQAEARRFLAELFQLTTGVDGEGKPLIDDWGVPSLMPWLEFFQKNLAMADMVPPVYLDIDVVRDQQIEASLGQSQGLGVPLLQAGQETPLAPGDQPSSFSLSGDLFQPYNQFEFYAPQLIQRFPTQKLFLQVLQASIDKELINLLASNAKAQHITEDFSNQLGTPSSSTPVSSTSRVVTSSAVELLWDVENESTSSREIFSYQSLQTESASSPVAFIR